MNFLSWISGNVGRTSFKCSLTSGSTSSKVSSKCSSVNGTEVCTTIDKPCDGSKGKKDEINDMVDIESGRLELPKLLQTFKMESVQLLKGYY